MGIQQKLKNIKANANGFAMFGKRYPEFKKYALEARKLQTDSSNLWKVISSKKKDIAMELKTVAVGVVKNGSNSTYCNRLEKAEKRMKDLATLQIRLEAYVDKCSVLKAKAHLLVKKIKKKKKDKGGVINFDEYDDIDDDWSKSGLA